MRIGEYKISKPALHAAIVEAEKMRAEHDRLIAAEKTCRNRTCGHPPFKGDGTPHRGRGCFGNLEYPYLLRSESRSIATSWGPVWEFIDRIAKPAPAPEPHPFQFDDDDE